MIRLQAFLWWVATWPHLVYRVPLVIVCGLLAWAIWMWLWDVFWPWARLMLKVLGKMFERIADALEFIPRKSKETTAYLEHIMGLCSGANGGYPACNYHPKPAARQA